MPLYKREFWLTRHFPAKGVEKWCNTRGFSRGLQPDDGVYFPIICYFVFKPAYIFALYFILYITIVFKLRLWLIRGMWTENLKTVHALSFLQNSNLKCAHFSRL